MEVIFKTLDEVDDLIAVTAFRLQQFRLISTSPSGITTALSFVTVLSALMVATQWPL
jgi:hypothetical protein